MFKIKDFLFYSFCIFPQAQLLFTTFIDILEIPALETYEVKFIKKNVMSEGRGAGAL